MRNWNIFSFSSVMACRFFLLLVTVLYILFCLLMSLLLGWTQYPLCSFTRAKLNIIIFCFCVHFLLLSMQRTKLFSLGTHSTETGLKYPKVTSPWTALYLTFTLRSHLVLALLEEPWDIFSPETSSCYLVLPMSEIHTDTFLIQNISQVCQCLSLINMKRKPAKCWPVAMEWGWGGTQ